MKFLSFFLTLFFIFISFSIQENQSDFSYLGFYSSSSEIISKLNPKSLNPYEHFRLGLAFKKEGQKKEALLHFANSCFRSYQDLALILYPGTIYDFVTSYHFKSVFYEEALYQLALLLFSYQEYKYVLKLLDQISLENSGLGLEVDLFKGKVLSVLKKYQSALKILEPLEKKSSCQNLARIRMASIYQKLKQPIKALEFYIAIINDDYQSWEAAIAAEQIFYVWQQAGLGDEETCFLAGKALYQARKYKKAIQILDSATIKSSKIKAEIDEYFIRAMIRGGDQTKISELGSILGFSKEQLDNIWADELWRMGKKSSAFRIYQKLLDSSVPEMAKKALTKIIYYLEDIDSSHLERYLLLYRKIYGQNSTLESDYEYFLWLLARFSLKKGDHSQIIPYLEEILKIFPEGQYQARARFWLYKSYLKTGRTNKAEQILRNIVLKDLASYYPWTFLEETAQSFQLEFLEKKYLEAFNNKDKDELLFYHNLLLLKEKDFFKRDKRLGEMALSELKPYSNLERDFSLRALSLEQQKIFKRTEKYFAVGYSEGINRELKIFSNTKEELKAKYIILSFLGQKYQQPFYSLYYALKYLNVISLKDNVALVPETILKIIYPLPFYGCLSQFCSKYQVSPKLLGSIIRAESYFNHRAVSSAKARGMTQLMPVTAKEIARNLGVDNYDLNKPCLSIRFGSYYLFWLKKYFYNEFEFLVSSYNAGPGSVKKWKKKYKNQDLDYFTEFIPFDETRDYVYKTRKFFKIYDLIY